MNNPDAKAAMDKEWKKLETISAWQLNKSQKQKGGYSGGTESDKGKSTLLHWWTLVISKMRSWNRNFRSIKEESCSEVTL